eukprot:1602129-Pyramimonas_sp.AAC.1
MDSFRNPRLVSFSKPIQCTLQPPPAKKPTLELLLTNYPELPGDVQPGAAAHPRAPDAAAQCAPRAGLHPQAAGAPAMDM